MNRARGFCVGALVLACLCALCPQGATAGFNADDVNWAPIEQAYKSINEKMEVISVEEVERVVTATVKKLHSDVPDQQANAELRDMLYVRPLTRLLQRASVYGSSQSLEGLKESFERNNIKKIRQTLAFPSLGTVLSYILGAKAKHGWMTERLEKARKVGDYFTSMAGTHLILDPYLVDMASADTMVRDRLHSEVLQPWSENRNGGGGLVVLSGSFGGLNMFELARFEGIVESLGGLLDSLSRGDLPSRCGSEYVSLFGEYEEILKTGAYISKTHALWRDDTKLRMEEGLRCWEREALRRGAMDAIDVAFELGARRVDRVMVESQILWLGELEEESVRGRFADVAANLGPKIPDWTEFKKAVMVALKCAHEDDFAQALAQHTHILSMLVLGKLAASLYDNAVDENGRPPALVYIGASGYGGIVGKVKSYSVATYLMYLHGRLRGGTTKDVIPAVCGLSVEKTLTKADSWCEAELRDMQMFEGRRVLAPDDFSGSGSSLYHANHALERMFRKSRVAPGGVTFCPLVSSQEALAMLHRQNVAVEPGKVVTSPKSMDWMGEKEGFAGGKYQVAFPYVAPDNNNAYFNEVLAELYVLSPRAVKKSKAGYKTRFLCSRDKVGSSD